MAEQVAQSVQLLKGSAPQPEQPEAPPAAVPNLIPPTTTNTAPAPAVVESVDKTLAPLGYPAPSVETPAATDPVVAASKAASIPLPSRAAPLADPISEAARATSIPAPAEASQRQKAALQRATRSTKIPPPVSSAPPR